MTFQNHSISVENITPLEKLNFQYLDKMYRKGSMIFSLIGLVIFFIITATFTIFFPFLLEWPYLLIVIITYLLISTLSLLFAYKSYDYMGYSIRHKDIIFKSGILFRSQTIVPFCRIQHCETNQGPIDRWLDLSEVAVFTAGGSGGDLVIPGLKAEDAEKLKAYITRRIANNNDEEE